MINYPVDVAETRWAILQLDTGEIIERNNRWPRADGGEIQGADPNFAYLLQVQDPKPDYDYRTDSLVGQETPDVDANELRTTWTVVELPVDEKKEAAELVELQHGVDVIQSDSDALDTRLMVSAILAYIEGLVLPAKVQTMADQYVATGQKLWKNREHLYDILNEIDQGGDPDLDNGWEAPDA